MKNRKYIILLALSLLLIIGYAALTSNIDIDGSTKIKANSWDIHFENVVLNSGNVELDDTDSEAIITENDNTKVTYKVSLKKPGDFYEFTVDAKNDGSIDGMVNLTTSMIKYGDNDPIVITPTNLPSYLKYSVTYNNNNPIEKYHELKAGALETYKIRVEFDKELENAELPENDIDLAFSFDVEYIQSGEEAITTGVNYQVIHRYQKLDNTYEEITENIKGEANSDVTPSFRPKKGFDNPEAQTVTIKEDGTSKVTYTYLRHKYQLTLEDSEYIETETPSGEYAYETPITLRRKDKENYTFAKWSNGETTDEITFNIEKDITIKPIYKSNYVTVTFNPNGGEVDPTSITVGRNTQINILPRPTQNKEGYFFGGWYTGITDGEKVTKDYIVEDDIEIYARWIEYNDCTFEGSLNQGAEYINGQYTYKYKQEYGFGGWSNITADGWGVKLTTPNSTEPITTKLCTSINGKPIVSMSYMFAYTKASEIDTSSIDTSNVINMTGMFYYPNNLKEIDVSSFDTSNVTNMNLMFSYNDKLENVDVSNFNTSKVTSMSNMFYNCSSLKEIDVSNFDTSNVTNISGMFQYTYTLEKVNMDNWIFNNNTQVNSLFFDSGLRNLSARNWKMPTDTSSLFWGKFGGVSQLESVDVTGWDLSETENISYLFNNCTKLKVINGLETFDTSNIINMNGVFNYTQFEDINISNWNTSNVRTMNDMFSNMTKLKNLDISGFDTSKVEMMQGMFFNSPNLERIYASDSFVTTALSSDYSSQNMFRNDTSLVGGAGTLFDENHIEKEYAHLDEGEANPGYFSLKGNIEVTFNPNGGLMTTTKKYYNSGDRLGKTPEIYHRSKIFIGWYTELDGGEKVDEETIINNNMTLYAHWRNTNPITVTFISNGGTPEIITKEVYENDRIGQLPKPYNEDYYLEGWYTSISDGIKINENTVIESDVTYYGRWEQREALFDTGSMVNAKMKNLANEVNSMGNATIDNTIKAIKRSYELPEDFIPSNENNIASSEDNYPIYIWFDKDEGTIYYYSKAEKIYLNEYSNYMFNNFKKVKIIELNDNIDTSRVRYMDYMFSECNKLETLDVSKWDVSNVNDMKRMFQNCYQLKELDVGDWNTSKVYDMSYMFSNCLNLKEIDVSKWDVSKVWYMQYMFYYTYIKTLDVSSFDTSEVYNMSYMFNSMSNITTIYGPTSFSTASNPSSSSMFTESTKLVGGAGTTYNSSRVNVTYARIDGGTSSPGYFTAKKPIDIKFDPNGGSVGVRHRSYNSGEELGELPVPTWKHHVFLGWYTDIQGGEQISSETIVSESVTYYARWHELELYTITFNPNGGTVNETSRKVYEGDKIGGLPYASKDESEMLGWYTGLMDGVQIDEDYIPTGNIELFAHYIPETGRLTSMIYDIAGKAGGKKYNISVIGETGLAYDEYNNLRYVGQNPNNYICWGSDENPCPEDNIYRIIGVFENMCIDENCTEKSTVTKIMRGNTYVKRVYDGDIVINDWSQYSVTELLNTGDYWNSSLNSSQRNHIQTVLWNVGGIVGSRFMNSDYSYAHQLYLYERSEDVYNNTRPTTWYGRVALLYPSDYAYATNGGFTRSRKACLIENGISNWGGTDCVEGDWILYNVDGTKTDRIATLTPSAEYQYYMMGISSDGYLYRQPIYDSSFAFKPTMYLKNEVRVIKDGGDGSLENPYHLADIE